MDPIELDQFMVDYYTAHHYTAVQSNWLQQQLRTANIHQKTIAELTRTVEFLNNRVDNMLLALEISKLANKSPEYQPSSYLNIKA